MALYFSDRVGCVTQSEIRAMTAECGKVDGLNLAQGLCDTGAPQLVMDAASKAMAASSMVTEVPLIA